MPTKKGATSKTVEGRKEEKNKDGDPLPEPANVPSTDLMAVGAKEEVEMDPKVEAESRDDDKTTEDNVPISRKRKADFPKTSKPVAKVPKQGSRTSSRAKGSSTPTTPKQMLNFLLSSKSLRLCYPEDELSSNDPKIKTYSKTSPATLTAFEHLLTASLLSKPLSHRLGMRSVRTLLNHPFSLNSPEKILEKGEKRVWEALEAARTQHRQKTTQYTYQMAQTYNDPAKMEELNKMAREEGVQGVTKQIKNDVKGMGATGAGLFCRRVQCVQGWGDVIWPFADSKSFEAIKALGLQVRDADELREMIEREVNWANVGDMGLDKSNQKLEMEQQMQVGFVVVLERAVGALLEGTVEEVKKAAAGHD